MRPRTDIRMVQALRAVACLLVVMFHAMPGDGPHWPNGASGVDLFFVISGYVMVVSTRDRGDGPAAALGFLLQRVRRIVPLYWLLTSAKLAAWAWRPGNAPHTHPTGWDVVASLVFIPARDASGIIQPPLGVGWTLNFEALFYALFAVCLAVRRRPLWMTPVLALLAVAGFFRASSWPAPLSLMNGMVLEFAAGMVLARLPKSLPVWVAPYVLAGAALLLVSLPSLGPWRFVMRGLPASGLLAAAVALESVWRAGVHKALLALGDASYAIYLVHPFFVPARYGTGPIADMSAILAAVLTGLLLHRCLDAPLQRWLGRRLARGAYPAGAGVLSG